MDTKHIKDMNGGTKMSNIFTKKWFYAAFIRSLKTMAQTAVSMLTVGQAFLDVNWVSVISVSVTAGIISVLTSIAGLPELNEKS